MSCSSDRRQWIRLAGAATLALSTGAFGAAERTAKEGQGKEEIEVPAVEDLMREHGILRRALLVYSEATSRLARGSGDVPADALGQTATLFRRFGEDYHEHSLEEQHVFPPLLKDGGQNATLAKVLTTQHARGRQITDYITTSARRGRLQASDATALANVLASFVRMYEPHAAIEDTVIFPAWKRAISPSQYLSSLKNLRIWSIACSARMALRMRSGESPRSSRLLASPI